MSYKRTYCAAVLVAVGLISTMVAHSEENEAKEEQAILMEQATFAAGCFWCLEKAMDKIKGVSATVSGFSGGHVENPTYKQVVTEDTGHVEVVQITYDPNTVSYRDVLETFWRNTDIFDAGGQFCDRGEQYQSVIYYDNEDQRRTAEAAKKRLVESGRFEGQIITRIESLKNFYPAEEYHQDYYKKRPSRYTFYEISCGRPRRLKEIWG